MRLGIVLVRVVAVIRREQRRLELAGDVEQRLEDATSSSMLWSCSSMKKWSRPKMSWKRAAASSAAFSSPARISCETSPPRQPLVAVMPS